MVDCHHEPPGCNAVWCGQVGCNTTVRCDCADQTQGARDLRQQPQRRQLQQGQAARGVVENSWRGRQEAGGWGRQEARSGWGGQTVGGNGEIQSGWGRVAETFMQDPRWVDYIVAVRRGDNPSLTWRQYVAALEYRRPQQGSHQERHHQREPQSQGPQSQGPQSQGLQRQPQMEAAARAPSKKALKLQEHRRNVALVLGQQRTGEEAEVQRRIQRRRQHQDEAENRAMAMSR